MIKESVSETPPVLPGTIYSWVTYSFHMSAKNQQHELNAFIYSPSPPFFFTLHFLFLL